MNDPAYASRDLFGDWWWFDSGGNPIRRLTHEEWKTVNNTDCRWWTVEMVKKTGAKNEAK
jgi:hypothetical protein